MLFFQLGIFIVLGLFSFSTFADTDSSEKVSKPNIVVLFADDLGYGDVKSLNPEHGKIPTPNIDALASEGIVFTDAHTSSSVCTPSRYSLLTGRYAWRTRLQRGVVSGYDPPLIDKQRLTLAGMLKSEGYTTVISGKWHLNFNYEFDGKRLPHPGVAKVQKTAPINTYIPDGPLTRGFDQYFGFHHARDMRTLIQDDRVIEHIDVIDMLPRTTNYAVNFIEQHVNSVNKEQPFFLYVPLGAPHTPIVPTKEWIGKSGLGKYGDFVMMTDAMIGRVIDAIDASGLKDNTLVIVSSDNGTSKAADVESLIRQGHFPSAEYRGLKSDLWDGGHRVPFILRWPEGTKPNLTRYDGLVGLTDVMATVADILNFILPDNAAEDSLSFLSQISDINTDGPNNKRQSIVHHSIQGKFSIRQGDWKLLLSPGSGGWSKPNDKLATRNQLPQIQLYNLKTDIAERHNLAVKHPKIVNTLLSLLKHYIKDGRSTPGPELKNDVEVDIWKENLNY